MFVVDVKVGALEGVLVSLGLVCTGSSASVGAVVGARVVAGVGPTGGAVGVGDVLIL